MPGRRPWSPALAAYLLLARLRPATPSEQGERPPGSLAWLHAQDPARLPALAALARELAEEDGIASLLTLPPGIEPPALPEPADRAPPLIRHAPTEAAGSIRAFLDLWRPDLLVWVGGGLRPALLAQARMPRLLVEGAAMPDLLLRGSRMPGLARATVPLIDRAVVGDAEAVARLRRAGLPEGRIAVGPPMGAAPPLLPCNERERRDLAATLGSRPVWLAGDLPLSELPDVIAAQRLALRSAHRLLVIVAPRDPEEAAAMARALGEAGMPVAVRGDGAEPDEAAQAYLAEGTGEMGLWLRLAPLTYVGGTLTGAPDADGQEGGRDPFEAAALGSALLHGPRTAPWEAHWRRLSGAGAARLVRTGAELGTAVESLLAPDRVAAMAHGAWDVATQGSEAVALVARMVREALDGAGAPR